MNKSKIIICTAIALILSSIAVASFVSNDSSLPNQSFQMQTFSGLSVQANLRSIGQDKFLIAFPTMNVKDGLYLMEKMSFDEDPQPEPPGPGPEPGPPPLERPALYIVVSLHDRFVASPSLSAYLKSKSIRLVSLTTDDILDPNIDKNVLTWIALSANRVLPAAYIVSESGVSLWSGALISTESALAPIVDALPKSSEPTISDIRVLFSPGGGIEREIVSLIKSALHTVYVQAYYFTSNPISIALREAAARGCKVVVILDRTQLSSRYSRADFLTNGGCTVLFDLNEKIAHNKVILIDGLFTVTGSFNFTASAEKENAENVLIIRDESVYAKYLANFIHHQSHSRPKVKVTNDERCNDEAGSCPVGT